jgi:hypothetical protein
MARTPNLWYRAQKSCYKAYVKGRRVTLLTTDETPENAKRAARRALESGWPGPLWLERVAGYLCSRRGGGPIHGVLQVLEDVLGDAKQMVERQDLDPEKVAVEPPQGLPSSGVLISTNSM